MALCFTHHDAVPEENVRNPEHTFNTGWSVCGYFFFFLSWSPSELSKIWDIFYSVLFVLVGGVGYFVFVANWEVVEIMAGTNNQLDKIVQIAQKRLKL